MNNSKNPNNLEGGLHIKLVALPPQKNGGEKLPQKNLKKYIFKIQKIFKNYY